jgi:hypothetical protein
MRRGHSEMTREQLIRVGHLLYMRYKPSELAEEIGCNTDSIYRSYIPAGCPHERDDRGFIWIVGTEFRDWARVTFGKQGAKMQAGQAYCFKCRQSVTIVEPVGKPVNRYLALDTGKCSKCGGTVNRAKGRHDKP